MKTKDLFFIFLLIGLILGLRVKKKNHSPTGSNFSQHRVNKQKKFIF